MELEGIGVPMVAGRHRESLEAVAERLEILRVAMGYATKRGFIQAIGAGISEQRWSSYLRGVALIPVPLAIQISRKFRVDLNWIYHGDTAGLRMDVAQRLETAETSLREGRR